MDSRGSFIPLHEETPGFGRGELLPHGVVRIETRAEFLNIRLNIYGLSQNGSPYRAIAIGTAGGEYRKYTLGQIFPDPLGRSEIGLPLPLADTASFPIRILTVLSADETPVLTGYVGAPVSWRSLREAGAPIPSGSSETPEKAVPAGIPEESPSAGASDEIASAPYEPEEPETPEEGFEEEEEIASSEPGEIASSELEDTAPSEPEETAAPPLPEENLSFEMRFTPEEDTPKEDPEPAMEQAVARDLITYMFHTYPKIYPFRQSGIQWIRIHPRDLAPLPAPVVPLETSPFLQRGYLQYKHLILGRTEDLYYLGVPFRYDEEQDGPARLAGFSEFLNTAAKAPESGEYGYWLMEIPSAG